MNTTHDEDSRAEQSLPAADAQGGGQDTGSSSAETAGQPEADAALHAHSHAEDVAEHARLHALGIEHSHTPDGTHCHSHTHTHENTRAVLNRLSRAIGHLQSVRRMVEDGRDCSEVLIQIAAVRSAIDNTGKIILQDHLKHCILDAAQEGDQKAIDDLCQAIDKYMK